MAQEKVSRGVVQLQVLRRWRWWCLCSLDQKVGETCGNWPNKRSWYTLELLLTGKAESIHAILPDKVKHCKHDLFTQGLKLRWQETVLPSAMRIADDLHLGWAAEEQKKQLSELHSSQPSGPCTSKYLPFYLL